MIVENAPALLMFSINITLSDHEKNELEELNSKTEIDDQEYEKKVKLMAKKYAISANQKVSFLPIPIDTKITPFKSVSHSSAAVKSVSMDYSGASTTTARANSVTLNFTTPSNTFANSLLAILDYIFSLDDVKQTVAYFSEEMVILNSQLISYSHNVDFSSNQNNIAIEVQRDPLATVLKIYKESKKLVPIVLNKL